MFSVSLLGNASKVTSDKHCLAAVCFILDHDAWRQIQNSALNCFMVLSPLLGENSMIQALNGSDWQIAWGLDGSDWQIAWGLEGSDRQSARGLDGSDWQTARG